MKKDTSNNIRMKNKKDGWINNPTKKQVILFVGLWFMGVFLLIASMTDLFKEFHFRSSYLLLYLLIIGSTRATFKLIGKYQKQKSLKSEI